MQVDLNGAPIVGPADIPVTEGNNTIVYVVGNQPTHTGTSPVVPIIQNLAIPTCDVPGPLPPQPAAGPDAV